MINTRTPEYYIGKYGDKYAKMINKAFVFAKDFRFSTRELDQYFKDLIKRAK